MGANSAPHARSLRPDKPRLTSRSRQRNRRSAGDRRCRPCRRAFRRTRRHRAERPFTPTLPQRQHSVSVKRSSSHAPLVPHEAHITRDNSPCMCSSECEPAFSCRSSTFCVTSIRSPPDVFTSCSSLRQRKMGPVGRRIAQRAAAGVVEIVDQARIAGRSLRALRHLQGCDAVQIPFLSRNVTMPLSADTPAPVRTTIRLKVMTPPASGYRQAARTATLRLRNKAGQRHGLMSIAAGLAGDAGV